MNIERAFSVHPSVSLFLNTVPFICKGSYLKQTRKVKVKQTFKTKITCWQKRSTQPVHFLGATQLVSLQDNCSQIRGRGWSMATYWEAYTFLSGHTFSQFQAFTALYHVGIITCKYQLMEKYNEEADEFIPVQRLGNSGFPAWKAIPQQLLFTGGKKKKRKEVLRVIPNLQSLKINHRSMALFFPSSLMQYQDKDYNLVSQ